MNDATALLSSALAARGNAVCGYSHYAVGAAIETDDGRIVTGCNIENATFGLTMCAERVALFKGLSEGCRRFVRIAIAADGPRTVRPCGACRQLLWEFAGDIDVLTTGLDGNLERRRMRALLPDPFDGNDIAR